MTQVETPKSALRLWIIMCLVLAGACNVEAFCQSRNQEVQEPLSAIPVPQRARLIERLRLLVEYQTTRQWDKMYDLSLTSIRGERNEEDFIRLFQSIEAEPSFSTLLSFAPTEAITIDRSQDGGAWEILGCARYRRGESIVQLKSGVTAELRQGEWFFSEVGVVTQVDGPEEPCPLQPQQHGQTAARSSSRCRSSIVRRSSDGRQR